jgi:hypothetical protein
MLCEKAFKEVQNTRINMYVAFFERALLNIFMAVVI